MRNKAVASGLRQCPAETSSDSHGSLNVPAMRTSTNLRYSRHMDAKVSGRHCSRRYAPGRKRGAILPLRYGPFGMFLGTALSMVAGGFKSSKARGCRRGTLNWKLRNDTADSEQIFESQWRTTRLANFQIDPTQSLPLERRRFYFTTAAIQQLPANQPPSSSFTSNPASAVPAASSPARRHRPAQ